MSLKAPYKSLELYNHSKSLVAACYRFAAALPAEEKTNLGHYLKASAISVHLNIAQGAFLRKKKKRRKYLDLALNALIVIDAALEALVETGLAKEEETTTIDELSSACYLAIESLKKRK